MMRHRGLFTDLMQTIDDTVTHFCRSEAGRHLVNSRKELLLAVRAAIDSRIDRLDELTGESESAEPSEARHVEVE